MEYSNGCNNSRIKNGFFISPRSIISTIRSRHLSVKNFPRIFFFTNYFFSSPYLKICIENIRTRKNVSASLSIIKEILGTCEPALIHKTLLALNSKFELLRLFFEELEEFQNLMQVALAAPGSPPGQGGSNNNNNNVVMSASHENLASLSGNIPQNILCANHAEQLILRLDFLNYVLGNSAVALDLVQVENLWDCLITKVPQPDLADVGFKWFARAEIGSNSQTFLDTQEITKSLLLKQLANWDPSKYTPTAFECLHR